MASIAELLTKLITLSSRVDSVSSKIDALTVKVEGLNDRVIRLEGQSDLIAEKAKNAAMSAVVQTNQNLFERMIHIEGKVNSGNHQPALGDGTPKIG